MQKILPLAHRKMRGQVAAEYLVGTAVFALLLFAPIFGDPLYLIFINAIRTFYQGFSAGMSMPVSPLGI
ncbi:MAG: hypothetical protein V4805_16425 [Pseudomonadota bacterium]